MCVRFLFLFHFRFISNGKRDAPARASVFIFYFRIGMYVKQKQKGKKKKGAGVGSLCLRFLFYFIFDCTSNGTSDAAIAGRQKFKPFFLEWSFRASRCPCIEATQKIPNDGAPPAEIKKRSHQNRRKKFSMYGSPETATEPPHSRRSLRMHVPFRRP